MLDVRHLRFGELGVPHLGFGECTEQCTKRKEKAMLQHTMHMKNRSDNIKHDDPKPRLA